MLVGLTQKQIKKLPNRIIGVLETSNIKELCEIYSAADIYVNLSKEETFGMTILEAKACGTNSIVYKNTACEEIVSEYGGIAVEANPKSVYKAILNYIGEIT